MAALLQLLESPLVAWVRTFQAGPDQVDFQELIDGTFLNDVMLQIDQRDTDSEAADVIQVAHDNNARIRNWAMLLGSLHNYYQDVLQQLVIMELPDLVAMVKEPTKETSLGEMQKVLLLLLGCAVQCDRKEDYINAITTLDLHIQQAMVSHIQEITDNMQSVLPCQWDPEMDTQTLMNIVHSLTRERNKYSQMVWSLTQERDYYQDQLSSQRGELTPPVHLEKYQLVKDVTQWRNKCGLLTADLEEKIKQISEMREDQESIRIELSKVKFESLSLSREAAAARSYRDEVDVLREKAERADRAEKEATRFKDKLKEMDYFKSRVEELRRDNDLLGDARNKMEEQWTASQKKVETIMDELVNGQLQLDEMSHEKEQLALRVQGLIDENATLEFERRQDAEGLLSSNLRRIISTSSVDCSGSQLHLSGLPISEELGDTLQSQMTRLEMENEELRHALEDSRQCLTNAQHDLEHVKRDTEHELERRVNALQQQTQTHRAKVSMDAARESQQYQQQMQDRCDDIKHKITDEYKNKMQQMEQRGQQSVQQIDTLSRQLHFQQESLQRSKEQCTRLDKLNKDLVDEREHFKQRIQLLQQNSQQRIDQLQQEVGSLQACTSQLKRSNDRINNLCDPEVNRDNAPYMVLSATAEQELLQKSGQVPARRSSPTNAPARVIYGDNMHSTPTKGRKVANGQRSRSNSQREDYSDVLRKPQHGSVEDVPRPATVLGVAHEQCMHTPDSSRGPSSSKRLPKPCSMPSTPEMQAKNGSPFSRNNPQYKSLTQPRPTQANRKSLFDMSWFSRGDKKRSTLPSKKTYKDAPVKSQHASPSHTGGHAVESKNNHNGSAKYHTYLGRSYSQPEKHQYIQTDARESDKDSGCATSPESPSHESSQGSPTTAAELEHLMTSFKIVSTESIRTQMRMSSSFPKMGEKWKMFVDKIVDLQDKNQQLNMENTELKRTVNSVKFSADRVEHLEQKNLQLEIENKKLRKIIETLQNTLGGNNPYDKRTYHYFSNV